LLWNAEENGPAGNEEGDLDTQESCFANKQQTHSAPTNPLIEVTNEEVLVILERKGFAIEQTSSNMGTSTYVGNTSSMLQYTYNMSFWVARKRPGAQTATWTDAAHGGNHGVNGA
jgi:hypothetical protein